MVVVAVVVSVPIQLAQCRFPGLAVSIAEILVSDKNMWKQFLSNSTRKLLRLEIS